MADINELENGQESAAPEPEAAPPEDGLDVRSMAVLAEAIEKTRYTVFRSYIDELDAMQVIAPGRDVTEPEAEEYIRLLKLKKLTRQKGEDVMQKLTTVYNTVMSVGASLIVMIDDPGSGSADLYIGVRNYVFKDASFTVANARQALEAGIKSQFPGSVIEELTTNRSVENNIDSLMDAIMPEDKGVSISAVSTVASVRDKSKTENKDFIQGIERFIDAMSNRRASYTAIFIADPITAEQRMSIRTGMEELYTAIAPFSKSVWSYNENESHAVMESLAHTAGASATHGTAKTQTHTTSHTEGTSDEVSIGISGGLEKGSSSSTATSVSRTNKDKSAMAVLKEDGGKVAAVALNVVGAVAGLAITGFTGSAGAPVGIAVAKAANTAAKLVEAKTARDTVTKAVTETIAKSLGMSLGMDLGYSHGWNRSDTESDSESKTKQRSKTTTKSDTSTSGTTDTKGKGRTLQIENHNKLVEDILAQLDEQLKRMKECEDYGLSNCGAYFISRSKATSVLAANTYRALITGDGSSVEKSAVNTWEKGDERTAAIRDYLRHFYQPVFARLWDEAGNYMPFSAGTMVSGLELPLHMGLPISSVSGVTVAEHAAFGRNLADKPFGLPLGELYHMGGAEGTAVMLDPNSLTAHTFITGSTGAGKSNTIYHMLDELKGRAKFLVIEPAKGEYKNVFGHLSDVAVYGTNPGLSPMLRINPFSFPEGVHVYEHIDRLVEIFNACWPMYAAMPAVLKESIERAYIAAGWDMRGSVSRYGMFPCFADVLEKVSEVIGESNYSADTKGDYIGALSMRLRSLTNGINSLIFTPDELPEGRVFDENVIIDLSRVGSTETKALIMGVLIMKLQEHRMSTASASNEALRHVTVLEEAHTLLRRTSAEQTTDGANLLGKAVEMLANSIAEMRTYGEGFIIADQSPGLLDMSVIRNTNTKIILRLPDFSDRELVGKAAGLNDDQIVELAKLERGVAAVYQNDWLEAVLCRVSKSGLDESPYRPQLDAAPDKNEITGELIRYLILPDSEKLKYSPERLRALERGLAGLNTPARVKADVLSFIKERRPKRMDALRRRIIYSLFNTTAAFDLARPEIGNLDGWRERMLHSLVPDINHFSADEQERILARLLFEQTLLEKNAETEALCKKVFSGLKNR